MPFGSDLVRNVRTALHLLWGGVVMLTVTGVLGLASLAACLGPALRASRVDPVVPLAA